MGLIEGLGKAALKHLGERVAYTGAAVVTQKIDGVFDAHTSENIIKQHPEFSHLIIRQRVFTLGEKYNVFDENKDVKYTVNGNLLSRKKKLMIYNAKGKELARVCRTRATLKDHFSYRTTLNFVLKIKGKKIGKLKIQDVRLSTKYFLDCYDWVIQGEAWTCNYTISSNDSVVMRMIFSDWADLGDAYVLEFPNPEAELPGLLIALTLESLNKTSKSKQIRRKMPF